MAIPKFTTFTSGAVPVEAENIDTDQIIPARFLKATERKGCLLYTSDAADEL